jgi:hypothetical protein
MKSSVLGWEGEYGERGENERQNGRSEDSVGMITQVWVLPGCICAVLTSKSIQDERRTSKPRKLNQGEYDHSLKTSCPSFSFISVLFTTILTVKVRSNVFYG